MTVDLGAAGNFLASNGRLLDRRRFQLLTGDGDPAAVLAAVDGYRNPDGGYGWGFEPDLRDSTSQPAAALHAFEAMAEAAAAGVTPVHARQLCDWLDAVTLADGGLPFALPVNDRAGSAPFWADADNTASSLQITSIVAMQALRVARHDLAVREHPWLARATSYCVEQAGTAREPMELSFVVQFLDTLAETRPDVVPLLSRLGAAIPPDGVLRVIGGLPDESMRPLDFAPYPDRPARDLLEPGVVAADLDRLASRQQDDGGWPLEWAAYSPAATLEWRGYVTVDAVSILLANETVSRSATEI